ncbi:MAG: AAA family ATPase [Mariprofundus sp.]|nr:AAA family ATPase [Mariprofundus sp.]
MRILQIRFKNLNSLIGEWEIDLTHPRFASDGIFAITGPTGAGKSTILDAICLALYGRTPRLNRVGKSGNEIMSRQTGECYAEVAFATEAGRFRCHWSQRRARTKAGGELQTAKQEISDADSGVVYETKLRHIAAYIEKVTGMDFDRFTRSMLLAQGGFAAFLQAPADARAPILEQITGTEIYSEISIRVHQKRSEEQKKLDLLEAEMAGLQLLSGEDEQRLSRSVKQKDGENETLTKALNINRKAVNWLDGLCRLEEALKQLEQQQQQWQGRQQAFEPDSEKLRLATQALELEGEYAALCVLRERKQKEESRRGEYLSRLPEKQREIESCEALLQSATKRFDTCKQELLETQPLIIKVREIEVKLAEKASPIQGVSLKIQTQEEALTQQQQQHSIELAKLTTKQKVLAALLIQITKTACDETLVEHLTGLCGRLDALKTVHERCNGLLLTTEKSIEALAEKSTLCQQWRVKSERQKELFEQSHIAVKQCQDKLKTVLEERALSAWRTDLLALGEKRVLIDQLQAAVERRLLSESSVAELGQKEKALIAQKLIDTEQVQRLFEKELAKENERGLLETQHSLIKVIKSFEQARAQLEDGTACPLCGSIEHPFAEGNVPVLETTMQQLADVRGELTGLRAGISRLKIAEAKLEKDLEQVKVGREEHVAHILAATTMIDKHKKIFDLTEEKELAVRVMQLQCEQLSLFSTLSHRVSEAEQLQKRSDELRAVMDGEREKSEKATSALQEAMHQHSSIEQQLKAVNRELELMSAEQSEMTAGVQDDLLRYGLSLSWKKLPQLKIELTQRRKQWLLKQHEKQRFEQEITLLEADIGYQKQQLQQSEAEVIELQRSLKQLMGERDALNVARTEAFSNKQPDAEEQRLTLAVEAALMHLNQSKEFLAEAKQETVRLDSMIEALEKSIGLLNTQLNSDALLFAKRIEIVGFSDEQQFKKARLPEEERKRLADNAMLLANQKSQLMAKQRDNSERLALETQLQLTDQSIELLQQTHDTMSLEQQKLQQDIGAINQQLTENRALRDKKQSQTDAIDGQKKECLRWSLLHELIGSSDGKKYRNFAQGLTFEMMVGHANRQLQKMTDRYLLIRDVSQPLELNVIDNYQGGEIRSTKNLSGGESFIVSLSLSLGLSHMASQKVRVDSLFLDEGFGSLDEESLEIALDTLSGLQQTGKLIGVISHVQVLKERIATQIEVVQQTGGRSTLVGPGITRVNAQ